MHLKVHIAELIFRTLGSIILKRFGTFETSENKMRILVKCAKCVWLMWTDWNDMEFSKQNGNDKDVI